MYESLVRFYGKAAVDTAAFYVGNDIECLVIELWHQTGVKFDYSNLKETTLTME